MDGLQEHVDLHAPGSSEIRQRCSMALQVLRVLLQAATANPELRLLDAMAVSQEGACWVKKGGGYKGREYQLKEGTEGVGV